MTLGDYLQWAMRQPWAWGTRPGLDCCKFAAKWAIVYGYIDPMVLVWSTSGYDSERSALRTIRAGGGLLKLWQLGMAHVGIPEADDARQGDIGILAAPTAEGLDQACGIFTGERWAVLGQRGMIFTPADVLALWRP